MAQRLSDLQKQPQRLSDLLSSSKSRQELEIDRQQQKTLMQKEMQDLPENTGGTAGSILGGYLTKSPYGVAAGGTIGQGLGKFIDLAVKKVRASQKNIRTPEDDMSWSDIFYESNYRLLDHP